MLIVYVFVQCVWLLFDDYMSALRTVDPVTQYIPYKHNSLALVVAAISVHIGLVQVLSLT